MKEIFNNNTTVKTKVKGIYRKLYTKALNDKNIDFFEEEKNKKVLLLISTKSSYYTSIFDLNSAYGFFIDKDKESDFELLNMVDRNSAEYKGVKCIKKVLNESNLISFLKEYGVESKNNSKIFFEVEVELSYLKKLLSFYDIAPSNLTITLTDVSRKNLDMILSEEQIDLLNNEMRKDSLGVLFQEIIYRSINNEKDFPTILMLLTKTTPYSYGVMNVLNTVDDSIVEVIKDKNKMELKWMLKYEKEGVCELKDIPYIINWNISNDMNTSCANMFKEVFDELNISEKEQKKILSKIFTLNPVMGRRSTMKGIATYFNTIKDLNNDLAIKKLLDFSKTRMTETYKNEFQNLFEAVLTKEEKETHKDLFKDIFPIFYQEQVSFKSFVKFNEEISVKAFEFKLKDFSNLFPYHNDSYTVSDKFEFFLKEVFNNYGLQIFFEKEEKEVVEKKKIKTVIDNFKCYLLGNSENIDMLNNEKILKAIKLVNENIDTIKRDVPKKAREFYLNLEIEDIDNKRIKKNKI